ncbi:hypothetical protein [Streptosporangium sp. NPDC051022]|uniref:hypothetical protein n=1 Tax=Streptosporangium sp. NPDC051022 TaxID=3155752 RepID=UPI00344AD427
MIRRRPPRGPGRHRDGLPRAAVHRRLWDGPARAEAERLDHAWPRWAVLYGTGSRLFYAVAAWPAPEPLILHDRTPEGLEERMRAAENAHATGPLPAAPERQRRIVPAPHEPVPFQPVPEPVPFRSVPVPREPVEP